MYLLVCVRLYIGHPVVDVLERVRVRNIIDESDAVCPLVVRACDHVKLLLSRCIPDLDFHFLPIDRDVPHL